MSFSSSIDAVKVAQALQIDLRYNAVLGGAYPKHFINDIIHDGNTNNEDYCNKDNILLKMKQVLLDETIKKAEEIKVAVVSFQNVRNNSPFLIIASRPQTTNENSPFNEDTANILEECAKQGSTHNRKVQYLGNANDGVSCDKEFVVNKLKAFLSGIVNHVATTDINHNGKNARGQLIGFNSIVTLGK